jgi:hypothetical protein
MGTRALKPEPEAPSYKRGSRPRPEATPTALLDLTARRIESKMIEATPFVSK